MNKYMLIFGAICMMVGDVIGEINGLPEASPRLIGALVLMFIGLSIKAEDEA